MSKERFKSFYDANAAFKVQRLKSDYDGRDGLMDTGYGTKNQTTIWLMKDPEGEDTLEKTKQHWYYVLLVTWNCWDDITKCYSCYNIWRQGLR